MAVHRFRVGEGKDEERQTEARGQRTPRLGKANTVKCAFPSFTSKGPKYTLNSVKLGRDELPYLAVHEVVDVEVSRSRVHALYV